MTDHLHAIEIKNFQGHKDTQLELSDGVNVIVGSSDAGKSSIVRAIKWATENKPTGDSFRSHWGGDTEVGLEFENQFITRVKSDKKRGNCYEVYWDLEKARMIPDSEPEIYRSFKTGVPKEIKDFFNLDELTFQYQHDAPFLLSNTAGEVAKYLNQIAQLEVIDKALSNVKSRKNKLNREIPALEENLKEKEKALEKYDQLDDIEELIENIEAVNEKAEEMESEIEELKELQEELQSLEKQRKKLVYSKGDEKKVDQLKEKIAAREKMEDEVEGLQGDLSEYQDLTKSLNKLTRDREKMEAEYERLSPETCPLCGGKWARKDKGNRGSKK